MPVGIDLGNRKIEECGYASKRKICDYRSFTWEKWDS